MKTLGFQTFLFIRGKPRGIKPSEIKNKETSSIINYKVALNQSILKIFLIIFIGK